MFHYDHNEILQENRDEVPTLCSEYNCNDNNKIKDDLEDIDPVKVLNNIHQKHSHRLAIAQLDINPLRSKFASLSTMIKNYVDLLLISETKIDSSLPTDQFYIDGDNIHRRDRDENEVGLLLYLRKDVSSTLLKTDSKIVAFYVEFSIRKLYTLHFKTINFNLQIKRLLQKILPKSVGIKICFCLNMILLILPGDLNFEPCE